MAEEPAVEESKDNPSGAVTLPDEAIPRRAPAWTEIELQTPTADPTQQPQPIPFSPPSAIPEGSAFYEHNAFSPHRTSDEDCRIEVGESRCSLPPQNGNTPSDSHSGDQTTLFYHGANLGSILLQDVIEAGHIEDPSCLPSDPRQPLNPFEEGQQSLMAHHLQARGINSPRAVDQMIKECTSQPTQAPSASSPGVVPILHPPPFVEPGAPSLQRPITSMVMEESTMNGWKKSIPLRNKWRCPQKEAARPLGHQLIAPLLGRVHPLQVITAARVLVLYPILLWILFAALFAEDWRHVQMSYPLDTGEVTSRTVLSLSGVSRLTETRNKQSPATSASVRELAVSFSAIARSMGESTAENFCNADSQRQTADQMLGTLSVREALNDSTPRMRRLALYHLLYGPSFRDVDCAMLKVFQGAGRIAASMIALSVCLVFAEWSICCLHLCSHTRSAHAQTILAIGTKRPIVNCEGSDLQGEVSPPFLSPAVQVTVPTATSPARAGREPSWAMIDLTARHGNSTGRDRPRFHLGVIREKARRIKSCMRRASDDSGVAGADGCCPTLFKSRQSPTGRSVCVLGDHVDRTGPGPVRTSEYLWWRPLRQLQKCVGFRPADHPRSVFFCASVLGGATLLLSCLTLISLLIGAIAWTSRTNQAACLDEKTNLRICEAGFGQGAGWTAVALVSICVYLHIKTPSLCERMEELKVRFQASNIAV